MEASSGIGLGVAPGIWVREGDRGRLPGGRAAGAEAATGTHCPADFPRPEFRTHGWSLSGCGARLMPYVVAFFFFFRCWSYCTCCLAFSVSPSSPFFTYFSLIMSTSALLRPPSFSLPSPPPHTSTLLLPQSCIYLFSFPRPNLLATHALPPFFLFTFRDWFSFIFFLLPKAVAQLSCFFILYILHIIIRKIVIFSFCFPVYKFRWTHLF